MSANVQRGGLRGGLLVPHRMVIDLSLSPTAPGPRGSLPDLPVDLLAALRAACGLLFFGRISDTQDNRTVPVQQRCPKAARTPPTY